MLLRGNQTRFITKLFLPLYKIDFGRLIGLLKTKVGMGGSSNGDVKTREGPGDDSSTTASHPWYRGDYLTLAPGANFPLISDMRDNKCWLVLTYQRHRVAPGTTPEFSLT